MNVVLLFILPIAAALIGAVVWLIARHRPAPGAWLATLRVYGPLLLGAHLLIFTAMMLGMRLPGNAIFDANLVGQFEMPAKIYSEWLIDFWFGPAVVCFTFLALIVFLSTTTSDRWAQWRGDILLIAGLIIGAAIVVFAMIYCPLATSHEVFIPAADLHYVTTPGGVIQAITIPSGFYVMRQLQSGVVLPLLAVFLLIVGGVLIVNFPGVPYRQPRLSRFAVWGVLSVFPCWPLVPILGTIAIVQIKRSGGRIYGLRLAAVEALVIPWILITGAIGGVFTAIVFVLLKIFASLTQGPMATPRGVAYGGPILISVIPALIVGFFVNRALWRAIVGRPARLEPAVGIPTSLAGDAT